MLVQREEREVKLFIDTRYDCTVHLITTTPPSGGPNCIIVQLCRNIIPTKRFLNFNFFNDLKINANIINTPCKRLASGN